MKTKLTHREVRVVVEGSGSFPIDMLRYDTCVPASESDAYNCTDDPQRPLRKVTLRRFIRDGMSIYAGEPRWASFGWRIVSVGEKE